MEMERKTYENKIRRMAKRQGYTIKKSRERYVYPLSATNFGKYRLLLDDSVICGERYDTTLEEIENHLLWDIRHKVFLSEREEWLKNVQYQFSYEDEVLIRENPNLSEIYESLKFVADIAEFYETLDKLLIEIKKIRGFVSE